MFFLVGVCILVHSLHHYSSTDSVYQASSECIAWVVLANLSIIYIFHMLACIASLLIKLVIYFRWDDIKSVKEMSSSDTEKLKNIINRVYITFKQYETSPIQPLSNEQIQWGLYHPTNCDILFPICKQTRYTTSLQVKDEVHPIPSESLLLSSCIPKEYIPATETSQLLPPPLIQSMF